MKPGFLLPLALLVVGWSPATPSAPTKVEQIPPKPKAENIDEYIGTYSVTMFLGDKAVDNKTLPPGQQLFFELKADKTWSMKNMMSGFDGTWSLLDGKIRLVPIEGPSGKVKDNSPMLLTPTPDRTRLVMDPPAGAKSRMELSFDSKAKQKIDNALKDRINLLPK